MMRRHAIVYQEDLLRGKIFAGEKTVRKGKKLLTAESGSEILLSGPLFL